MFRRPQRREGQQKLQNMWFFRNLLVIFNWLVWLMCEKWRRAFKEWGPGNDDVAKRG